jgi:hypothetical protein
MSIQVSADNLQQQSSGKEPDIQRLLFLPDNRAKTKLLGNLKSPGHRLGRVLYMIELQFWFDAALRELVKMAPTRARTPSVPADALA